MVPVTIAVLAHNEEKNLPRALESVKDWANEIVVVDASSTDQTANIARRFTDKVIGKDNNPQLNVNKMAAFQHATQEWIFYLDADEELTTEIKAEIELVIKDPSKNGYWVPRKNIVFGHWLRFGGNYPDLGLRLFRRDMGRFAMQHVHEQLEVDGTVGQLRQPFNHYTYETVGQWVYKMNFYTDRERDLIWKEHRNPWRYILVRSQLKPLRQYLLWQGWRDGRLGFVYASFSGIYEFVAGAKALFDRPDQT